MIRIATVLISGSLLLGTAGPSSASNPSGPDVVAKCAKALGGQGNWQQIRSFEMLGKETYLGVRGPLQIHWKRPNLYRIESRSDADRYIDAYDGNMVWVQRETTLGLKGNWPAPAPQFIAAWIEVDAELAPPFIDYLERGQQANFIGEDDCDGRPCYGIEFIARNGQAETWHVDLETFLPISRLRIIPYVGHRAEDRVFYEDYREVSGVLIPFHREQEVGNLYRVRDLESVEVNVEIADSDFALPPPSGMEMLRDFAGRFHVQVESFLPGMPPLETAATSEIRANFHDASLTEDVSFVVLPGFHLQVHRFFSYDRFRDVFRLAYFDNSTSHLDILEGSFDGGRLVVSNIGTDTGWVYFDQPRHTRQSFYEISEGGFKLDVELSTDAGKTWSLERRLTYTRATPDAP